MMGSMTSDEGSSDAEALRVHASSLADGIVAALPGWVEASVARRMVDWSGSVPAEVATAARTAGVAAQADVAPRVRDLLAQDVDDQRTTPLALIRSAVSFPSSVLRSAGVPPVVRDPMAEDAFPDDDYDLTPGSFADLDPALAELGLVWGAAKAHVIITRRKAEREQR
jgi:hypothetical protein